MTTNEYSNEAHSVAHVLYAHYCVMVGGTAFDGKPLPAWPEFVQDVNKSKQACAWLSTANLAISYGLNLDV